MLSADVVVMNILVNSLMLHLTARLGVYNSLQGGNIRVTANQWHDN